MVGDRAAEREDRAHPRLGGGRTISLTTSGARPGTLTGRLLFGTPGAERVGLQLLPEREGRGPRLLLEIGSRGDVQGHLLHLDLEGCASRA